MIKLFFLVPVRCYSRYTPFSEIGNGKLVYLDRQHLSCGVNEVVQAMMLERHNSSRYIRYNYTCCKIPYECNQQTISNPLTDDGNGDTAFLDQQTVQCSNGGFITDFRLERNSRGNKVHYIYKCCNIVGSNKISYDAETHWNDQGNGNMIYLDRHHIYCQFGYGLTKFRLVQNERCQYQYKIKCTKIYSGESRQGR